MKKLQIVFLFHFFMQVGYSYDKPAKLNVSYSQAGHIFIKILVEDKPATAMVDFGDPYFLTLSSAFCKENKLALINSSDIVTDIEGNKINIRKGRCSTLEIANYKFSSIEFSSSENELEAIAKDLNYPFDAVIGWGFFKNYLIRLNLGKNEIWLNDNRKSKKKIAFEASFNKKNNYLIFPITVNNISTNAMVETGSVYSLLDSSIKKLNEKTIAVLNNGRRQQIQLNVMNYDLSHLKPLNVTCLVGLDNLKKIEVLIDVKKSRILFLRDFEES